MHAIRNRLFGSCAMILALAGCAGAPETTPPETAAIAAPVAAPVAPAPAKAVTAAGASAHLVAETPERYRALFAQVEIGEYDWAELEAAPPENVFEFLARGAVKTNPAAAGQLAAFYKDETSPKLRQIIMDTLPLRGAGASAETRQLVSDVASTDPDVERSLAAAQRLDETATDEIVALLRKRAQQAEEAGDAAGARKLRDAIDHYQYEDVTLPKYAYKPPPRFSVLPASAKSVRVLAFGDFGTGSEEQISTARAMQAFHKKTPFAFGITLGDNFYGAGLDDPAHPRWKTQWEDLYSPLGVKFYPTYGNHDVNRDSPAAELAYSASSKSWKFPAPYYTFTAGSAQFFAIDTMRLTDDELDWLDAALKASTAKWKVVYGHYQIYSATRGDSGLVKRLLPVLKRNKADVYLCGHDHNLQELSPEDGVHFFVMGAGGAGLYDFDQFAGGKTYPRSVYRSKEHGFGVVEATPNALTISLVALDGRTLHQDVIRR